MTVIHKRSKFLYARAVNLVATASKTAPEAAIPSGSSVPLRSGWSPLRPLFTIGFRQLLLTADAPQTGTCAKSLVYSLSTSLP